MTEKPILFSSAMVRKILLDQKTMSRRVFKLLPDARYPDGYDTSRVEKIIPPCPNGSPEAQVGWTPIIPAGEWPTPRRCPYGEIGSTLWVRENLIRPDGDPWLYATDQMPVMVDPAHETEMIVWAHHKQQDFCPSIHMPRWASRITLTITGVRVERLQEITEADAKAEGCSNDDDPYWRPSYADPDSGGHPSYRNSFSFLWDSINGRRKGGIYSWHSDPFVWVLSFSRAIR